MINIFKMIQNLRKKSEISLGFNLWRFKYASPPQEPPDAGGESIDPDEWMRQHAHELPPEDLPSINRPPQGAAVAEPSGQPLQFSDDFSQEVSVYVRSNMGILPSLEQYRDQSIEAMQLTDPQARFDAMEAIPVSVDLHLYEQIKNKPSLASKFEEIAHQEIENQQGGPVEDTATGLMLMGVMMAKAKAFAERPDVAKWNSQLEQHSKKIEKANIPIQHKDPGLNALAQKYFDPKQLSPEKKEEILRITGKDWDKIPPSWLQNAVDMRLGTPKKPTLVDQRMNFFIKNPHYLEGLFQAVDENGQPLMDANGQPLPSKFVTALRDGLSTMEGVDPSQDIPTQIAQADKGAGRTRALSKLLNDEAGTDLYKILKGLISQAHPDIAYWIKNYLNDPKGREKVTYQAPMMGQEGRTFESQIASDVKTHVDFALDTLNPAQRAEVSQQIADLLKVYLKDSIDDMELLRQQTVDKLRKETVDAFRQLDASGNADEKVKNKTMDLYNRVEKLNAYSIAAIKQMNDLLTTKADEVKDNGDSITYSNKLGKLQIPKNVLLEIFGGDGLSLDKMLTPRNPEERLAQVVKYMQMADSGKIKNPLVPDWSSMTDVQLIANSYMGLVDCKKAVLDITKGKIPSTPEQYRGVEAALQKNPEIRDKITELSGGDIPGFIYMTLNQDDSLIKYWEQWPSNEEDPKKRREMERKLKHSVKSEVGAMWHVLLPYIQNAAGGDASKGILPFDPKSIRGFTELFDSDHAIRDFGSTGQAESELGDRYSDIYYKVRGEEPPLGTKTLHDMYNRGLQGSGTSRGDKTSLDPSSWYYDFFKLYEKYRAKYNALEARYVRTKRYSSDRKSKEDLYLKRAVPILTEISKIEDPISRREQYKKRFEANKVKIEDPSKPSQRVTEKRGPRPFSPPSKKQLADYKEANNFNKFMSAMESWDGGPFGNYYYYVLLGATIKGPVLYDYDKEIDKIRNEGVGEKRDVRNWSIVELEEDLMKDKKTLQKMVEPYGLSDEQKEALKLAYVYYLRMKYAIQRLSLMKQSMSKFASTKMTMNSIDRRIDGVRKYYMEKIKFLME